MEILKQIGRTLLQMALIGAAIGLLALITFTLNLPVWVFVVGFPAVIIGYIIWSGPKHAYWAPVANRINALKWERSDGTKMETVIENAIVQAGMYVRSKTLRVSIYECESGKRVLRKMIGDDATYLGRHGIGVWFHIADKYHARRDGLVCMDIQTGEWLYHTPKSEIEYVSPTKKKGIIDVEDEAENVIRTINLGELEANV